MSSPAIVEPRATAPAPRTALRIGIMQSGRLVEERVLGHLGRVTIGTAPASTFIIPSEQLPPRWRPFERLR